MIQRGLTAPRSTIHRQTRHPRQAALLCKASWLDKSNGTRFDDRHPAASVETPIILILLIALAGALFTAIGYVVQRVV
jgi:hypothetical protein